MKVSALIPTYNRRDHVFRAIDSVLAQTVPVDEIIVVDDGSTDGTAEAVKSHYDTRVKLFRQDNGGVSAARRRAVDEAQGDWVAFLDSDDEWLPGRNAEFLKAASSVRPEVALIFGNTLFITDEGPGDTVFDLNGWTIKQEISIFHRPLLQLDWTSGRPCTIQSTLIRRPVLLELESFSEGLCHSEDFLAGMQIACKYSFAAIPSVVTKIYRTSDLSGSSLEPTWESIEDPKRAAMLGAEFAASTTGGKLWRDLHPNYVRSLCKWRAQHHLPIRRIAFDQLKFGVSAKSIAFLLGALLGGGFFRAGFATKRKLKSSLFAGAKS